MDDNTKNLIQNHIDSNEVCLFMKGTPDAPQCGFSMATSNILKVLEVAIEKPHCGASGVPFMNKQTSLFSISFLIKSFVS